MPATIPAADLSPHNITQMPDPYRDVSSSTYKCAPSRRGFSPPLTWADPQEQLAVVFMAQTPGLQRRRYRQIVNALVYQAIID